MTKELTTTNSMEMLHALRNTVAPGLTEPEFLLFAEMCRATGLNPATKEIWAIKAGGRLQLMTGINGFLRIANSHPMFDGLETSFEWDGKQLVSCTVKVHRKDRKFPSVATAYWNEYSKKTPIWAQMPTIMLSKCAKSLAIREAFIQELGGLYTQEEMPADFAPPKGEVINAETGEIIEVKKPAKKQEIAAAKASFDADDLPDWDGPRAKTTFYDIGTLDETPRAAAAKYLSDCEAKEIMPGIWRSSIRLEKLTSCIVEESHVDKAKATTN